MTQMRSRRAIWWRSENPAACRELTLLRSFAITAIALLAVSVFLNTTLFIIDELYDFIGLPHSPMLSYIGRYVTMALILPILVFWINIPVVALYLFTAIRRRWTGVLPMLIAGFFYGLLWAGVGFWVIQYNSRPNFLTDIDYFAIVAAGVLNAGLVWLVTRWMLPEIYQRPAAK